MLKNPKFEFENTDDMDDKTRGFLVGVVSSKDPIEVYEERKYMAIAQLWKWTFSFHWDGLK